MILLPSLRMRQRIKQTTKPIMQKETENDKKGVDDYVNYFQRQSNLIDQDNQRSDRNASNAHESVKGLIAHEMFLTAILRV